MSLMRVEQVTNIAQMEQLPTEWVRLWSSVPIATPFQSAEWLIPWWRHVGRGKLLTLAMYDEELIGLAPLYIYQSSDSTTRRVFLLGMGHSDYLDVLCAPGWENCVLEEMFAQLHACRRHWDVCEFQQLPSESPCVFANAPEEWTSERLAGETCPVLALPQNINLLMSSSASHLWDNIKYYRRRAAKMGEVRFESANENNLHEMTDALFRLHHARWSMRGSKGVLADDGVVRFHREALPLLFARGLLRMYIMWVDQSIAAVFFGLSDLRKRTYYYLSGFDPHFERLSPGTLIIAHAIEEAIREGCEHFDFLRGRESYKYTWGARDTPTFGRRWFHNRDHVALHSSESDAATCHSVGE
jgi:CelD/BcsL family acetyltransferase involved in cellulose biosynthesis